MRGTRTRTRRAAWGCLLWLAAAPAAADCAPWPDEPDPLPTLDDADPLRTEWAALRVRELASLAERFKAGDPVRARQLWSHVLCLDPSHVEARRRTAPGAAVRVHRPPLRDEPYRDADGADPWAGLDAPLGVRSVERIAAEGVEGRLFARVRELDEQVSRARFAEALGEAETLRSAVEDLPGGSSRAQLLVEVEVLAATAELALGREAAAEASLGRALDAYPGLELDASTTSPKVLRALESARAARDGGAP